ncbi:unnamed protein product [Cylindrotheca closterium]|uniref:Uncharacterized protein n=1 Tax=Cylindrotheca closterium TaxID=2856 RepID=A0AAD2CS23_9STRA|nr:unnamed protein product [Cylindrotheca closterium]
MEPIETDGYGSLLHPRRAKSPITTNPDHLWDSKQELASFLKQDKHLQRVAMSRIASFGGDADTKEISYVGLSSEKELKQSVKRMKEAKTCVLAEQMQQEEDFYNEMNDLSDFRLDQETIAHFFSIYSIRAAKVAHMKGLQL